MANTQSNHVRRSKTVKRLNIKAIALMIIVIFLIFFIPIFISNSGYKGLLKDYCKAVSKQDYELYKSVFPNFIVENGLEDLLLFTYDTGENYMENMYKSYTDTYGKKVKLSCKINDRTKLSKNELLEYSKNATSLCTNNKEINIKKGYKLNISMKYKGKSSNSVEELSVIVIKYDGNWYIYDGDIYFC